MSAAARSWIVVALLLLAGGGAQAGPRLYFGAECAAENSAAVPIAGASQGIVLEGKSGQIISLDIVCADRPVAFRALASALRGEVGSEHVWSNAAGTSRGLARITWQFRDHGVPCRDFALDHVVNGRRYLRQGTACLETDGNWHLH